jgi:hypothetical protein
MEISVAAIREKYPSPVKAPCGQPTLGTYCVGGALCKFIRYPSNFPSDSLLFPNESLLSKALKEVNPHLSESDALIFAREITVRNDEGNFHAAWMFLAQAVGDRDYIKYQIIFG